MEKDQATLLAESRTNLAHARSHMANERTHLAYLRTSITLISFGVTLNRFSIYLKESHKSPGHLASILYQAAVIGLGVVAMGLIILCWSLYRYRQVNDEIIHNTYKSPSVMITILTLSVLILGGLSTVWLLVDWK